MKRNGTLQGIVAAICVLLLILDTKTAIAGAQDGITMCLKTVIPSLLPFIVLTGILGSTLIGTCSRLMQPLSKLCGIPKGAESILILGLISGYPVGAQLVSEAYHRGNLNRSDARRMLAFCSNAGPSFIFGILGSMFSSALVPWALWCTHIISALLVGMLLPGKSSAKCTIPTHKNINLAEALEKSMKTMATICGWVVIFRIVIAFLNRWIFWLIPIEIQALISGTLELANGCITLSGINENGVKFLLAGSMLSFGGLCVFMQTLSVTRDLGSGLYFPGKVMQTVFSFGLNSIVQIFLFSPSEIFAIPVALSAFCIAAPIGIATITRRKKVVAFA